MTTPQVSLALYHFQSCPFCHIVRQRIRQMGLNNIELRDTMMNPQNRHDLINGGGKSQVPCLLITDQDGHQKWLYESADINRYLEKNFG